MQDIHQLKIFEWIESHIINYILKNAKIETFSTGDFIIQQGDESNGKWYIIQAGTVNVIINNKKIASLWKWDIFWEIALLNEEERTASIQAVWNVETIILTQDSLLELINNGNESINKSIMNRIEENLTNNY